MYLLQYIPQCVSFLPLCQALVAVKRDVPLRLWVFQRLGWLLFIGLFPVFFAVTVCGPLTCVCSTGIWGIPWAIWLLSVLFRNLFKALPFLGSVLWTWFYRACTATVLWMQWFATATYAVFYQAIALYSGFHWRGPQQFLPIRQSFGGKVLFVGKLRDMRIRSLPVT